MEQLSAPQPQLTDVRATCWRAVPTGGEAETLSGTTRAGRWNRAGQRTLYMSGSAQGVAAAMARYGDAPRTLVALKVSADRLIDLRDARSWAAFALHPADGQADWQGALARGEVPPTWRMADVLRGAGAGGLIDPSRRLPGAWHVVLFRWNVLGQAQVRCA